MASRRAHSDITAIISDFADGLTLVPDGGQLLVEKCFGQQRDKLLVAKKDLRTALLILQPKQWNSLRISYECKLRLGHSDCDLGKLAGIRDLCVPEEYRLSMVTPWDNFSKSLASLADDLESRDKVRRKKNASKYAAMIKLLPE
ncbi:hypothetical protein M885DRAFT_559091 [Pelagophyceae sp. CCMP2097]|nr:hypothetical protein M885DRAFT_559091 [Pelagophyceae sp. CCMP2097]